MVVTHLHLILPGSSCPHWIRAPQSSLLPTSSRYWALGWATEARKDEGRAAAGLLRPSKPAGVFGRQAITSTAPDALWRKRAGGTPHGSSGPSKRWRRRRPASLSPEGRLVGGACLPAAPPPQGAGEEQPRRRFIDPSHPRRAAALGLLRRPVTGRAGPRGELRGACEASCTPPLSFTRQQSFVDKIDENSGGFPALLHDFRNNAVNTPNAVVKVVPFAVNMLMTRKSSIEAK
jgi:hypothetical protein